MLVWVSGLKLVRRLVELGDKTAEIRRSGRGITPEADTVLMCWQPVLAVVNDLDKRLPGRTRPCT